MQVDPQGDHAKKPVSIQKNVDDLQKTNKETTATLNNLQKNAGGLQESVGGRNRSVLFRTV